MKINICFSADNNYVKPLSCSITSILKNADIDTDLNIFILENNFSEENKNKILSLKKLKICEIKFIKIEDNLINIVPNFRGDLNYISKVSFFRFFIADLLKDIDKIIYLDCDVIVLSDLKSLFMQDIQNYYVAGVEDLGFYRNRISKKFKHLKEFDFYINSGVLLINSYIWRQEQISLKLLNVVKEKSKEIVWLDQDAINIVCKNKIKPIDYSYNLQVNALKKDKLQNHPKKKQIIENYKRIKILHYTTSKKPWNYFEYIPLRKYYLDYEKLTPFKTSYKLNLKIKFFIQDLYFNSTLLFFMKRCIKYLVRVLFHKTSKQTL